MHFIIFIHDIILRCSIAPAISGVNGLKNDIWTRTLYHVYFIIKIDYQTTKLSIQILLNIHELKFCAELYRVTQKECNEFDP